jgi:hypothetical protein
MSDDEEQLADTLSSGHCPDCKQRGFVLGPMAGHAINIECANVKCRARYNVALFGGNVMFAQRIERSSEWPSEPEKRH